jgi:hypothetical protein
MNSRRLRPLLLAGAILAAGCAVAHAQTATLGTPSSVIPIPNVGQNDLVPVIPNGVGGVPTKYIQVGTAAGQSTYQRIVATTAFTITPNNATTLLFLDPAGTLATGTLTMAVIPSDGQNFCLYDSHTQTAITIQANIGQTIAGTPATALVANTRYCWVFIAQTSTWYPTQ